MLNKSILILLNLTKFKLHTLKSTCCGIRTPGRGPPGYRGDIKGCKESNLC